MFVVFDLDGTLALCGHREHHISVQPKDWRAFYAACWNDTPAHHLIATMTALRAAGHRVEVWSGRSDEVAAETMDWFVQHVPNWSGLTIRLRKVGDHRHDTVIKREWAAQHGLPDLVFEDRARVVAMWREMGAVCCQVAPGEF